MFPHLRGLDRIHQRAPRRILKDRMHPFHLHTEEEFICRYRLIKQATRSVIEQVSQELAEVHGNRETFLGPNRTQHDILVA
ncbi:hypothetical protein E2C01_101454 [Portunus trituberculatus]|uniref:Uncharacterized protein n=1 Tax=Portunus trituberculatus TaxID=210409 RepID=A0A5B7KFR5_PORTR|nr:hypothetical protein [Portunus trituberculatus]